jgi:ABC-type transport system involved in cytochrome c biogenesis permease subunit
MSATELLRLSYYAFTAASIAVVAAAVFSLADVLRLVRSAQLVPAANPLQPWRAYATPPTASGHVASSAVAVAAVFAGLAVLLRALATGRGPYSDMYEFSIAFIFVALVGYRLLERSYGVRPIGTIALPVILGMVAYVWSLPADVREDRGLIPALDSKLILTAHVSTAVVAYAAFALSFAAAALWLVAERWPRPWLPSPELLDDAAFRSVTIGFPAQTLLLILGSLWAHQAWGGYWSWDPKETAALFTWLVYGAYLHTRTLRGWRGTRSAVFLVVAFLTVVFTYFGNYWFGGLHAYSGM